MKSLVLTVNVKPEGAVIKKSPSTFAWTPNIYELCIYTTKEWAQRMNADFLEITDDSNFPGWHPTWQRMSVFLDNFNEYDQILYVDGDYAVHELTPNILEWSSKRPETLFARLDNSNSDAKKMNNYFNAGMFIIKRDLINQLKPWYQEAMEQFKNHGLKDQTALNWMMQKAEPNMCPLSHHWNGIFSRYHPMFAVHYVGPGKVRFTEKDLRNKMLYKMQLCSQKTPEELESLFIEEESTHIPQQTKLF